MVFRDREQAGQLLAARLERHRADRPVVLGLTRGGVPVAARVARALGADLDVLVVRKLGAPSCPEYAIGAIAEGGAGAVYVRRDALEEVGIGEADVASLAEREAKELQRRVRAYRGDRPAPSLAGRIAIVVDDGVATGATARAAARAARQLGAERVVLAAPVIAAAAEPELRADFDEIVAVHLPERFVAVGLWYERFDQVSDEEVVRVLRSGAKGRPLRADPGGNMRALPVLDVVRRRLRAEPRIDTSHHAVALSFARGVLTMEGELGDVGAKKIALVRAAAVPGVEHIVDRLRVAPARAMGDAEIRDHVRDLISQEPALQPLARSAPPPESGKGLRPDLLLGAFGISVAHGVVTLDGAVPSLSHKRLAGVLAWWVPGVRDVVNGLEVVPPEEDGDDEISDAVRIALEKDPLVDAGQVAVTTRRAVVRLDGLVRSDLERAAAERDAWCTFGVDGVKNDIEVRAGAAPGRLR